MPGRKAGTGATSQRTLQAIAGTSIFFLSEQEAQFKVLSRGPTRTELQFFKFRSGCCLDDGLKGRQRGIKGDPGEDSCNRVNEEWWWVRSRPWVVVIAGGWIWNRPCFPENKT